jgi:iron complex outermembrane receptor protein
MSTYHKLTTPFLRALAIAAIVMPAVPTLAAGQSQSQLPDIKLEELMGVSVQNVFGASERLQPVTEAPSSVTIITAEDISRYGYRTLAEILRGVRGFYLSNDRNYS